MSERAALARRKRRRMATKHYKGYRARWTDEKGKRKSATFGDKATAKYYENKKKAHASKKKQHHVVLKEVRVRPKIAQGDLDVKVRRAREFLAKGDKVQVTCLFRGREMAHQEVGLDVMRRFVAKLEDIAKIEREPRLEGRRMNMIVVKAKK